MRSSPSTKGSDRLRILVAHRYFWPDTPPYASMLRCIAAEWQSAGHNVDILSSQPSYKSALKLPRYPKLEVLDGLSIERLNLPTEASRPLVRLLNILIFCSSLAKKILINRYDVVQISTVPPVIGSFTAAVASKLIGARFIYHCMDIHPEIGRLAGSFRNSFLYTCLRLVDSWTCRQANPIIVLSSDMEATLRARPHGEKLDIVILNNFSLPGSRSTCSQSSTEWSSDRMRILFAGNIGRFQSLDKMILVMSALKYRDDIEFVMVGEGVAKASLMDSVSSLGVRVHFLDHQPIDVCKSLMKSADMGFIGLIPDAYRYAYPSKTMTYLEQGCPLLLMIEPESELAIDATEHGYGLCISHDNVDSAVKLLSYLADNRMALQEMRSAARQKYETAFTQEQVLRHWRSLLASKSLA